MHDLTRLVTRGAATGGAALFLSAAAIAQTTLPGDGPVLRDLAQAAATGDDALVGVPTAQQTPTAGGGANAATPSAEGPDGPVSVSSNPAADAERTPVEGAAGAEERPYMPTSTAELRTLLEGCESADCMSYVSGAVSGIAVYAILAENPTPFCTGGSVPTAEIRDAIIETIDTVPELSNQHPALAILTAFGRYWPCMTRQDVVDLQASSATLVAAEDVAALAASGGHMLDFGAPDAEAARTIHVFHDPNCSECRRFRSVTDELAETGWRVKVYPVSSVSEDSAGYGAIQLALRDIDPAVTRTLYDTLPDGPADFAAGTTAAQNEGVDLNTLLRSVSTSDAYERVEQNTRTMLEMGAEGTPAWIVGTRLFEGYLSAPAIENTVAGRVDPGAETAAGERGGAAPSSGAEPATE